LEKLFFALLVVILVPLSISITPTIVQAQDDDNDNNRVTDPSLIVINGGLHDNIALKATQEVNGAIELAEDFEIEPEDVVTVERFKDFYVGSSQGSIFSVKVTDEKQDTIKLDSSQKFIKQNLASKAYLLDIVVLMDSGEKQAYQTILLVLDTAQTINEVNIQNIINTFITKTENSDTRTIFRDGDDDNDNEPPQEEPSICYFKPNDSPLCEPDEEGNCPDYAPNMNQQGNCHPSGCPDGYSMLDDDETGTCYSDRNITVCPTSEAKVLDPDDCAIYEPDEPETSSSPQDNDTSTTEEPETIDTEIVIEEDSEESTNSTEN